VTIAPDELERLPRDQLIARAQRLGVERAEVMTRVELRDEIVRRIVSDEAGRRRARGWLGVARDLVASLIETGLNMPDAAKLVRTGVSPTTIRHQPPVATVTLAEIYATQGHVSRALAMLDEVIAKEPDHAAARSLRDRLRGESGKREPIAPPEPELELDDERLDDERLELVQPPPPGPEQPAPAEPEIEPEKPAEPEAPPPKPDEPEIPEPKQPPEPEVPEPAPTTIPQPEPPRPGPVVPRARDAIATIVTEAGSVWVYWEIAESSLDRARRRWPDGRAVVQVIALEPRWEGALRYEHQIAAEPVTGESVLPPFGERAVARAALGWRAPDGFHPLAVGTELAPPNGPGGDSRVRFAPSARAAADLSFQQRALARFVAGVQT
jgi:hypothetical protein